MHPALHIAVLHYDQLDHYMQIQRIPIQNQKCFSLGKAFKRIVYKVLAFWPGLNELTASALKRENTIVIGVEHILWKSDLMFAEMIN